MKDGQTNLLACLLALAMLCPFVSCAQSAPVGPDGTGGTTGSGGSASGGSASGGSGSGGSGFGGATGGHQGSGGSGAGGQIASSGCGGQASGTGGQAGNINLGTDGGGASPYANFSTVEQIVQIKCGGASCHNSVQNPMFASAPDLYTALTTDQAPDCKNYTLVKAGDPTQSAMYLAISGACPCVPQMPDGCTGGDPNGPDYSCLPPDYIEGVRQWIANGAPQQ
jgi:hypothetical protein